MSNGRVVMRPGSHPLLASEKPKEGIMQELGADEAIDYTSTNFEDVLKANPVDVVVDPMAGTDPIMRV